MNEWHLNETLCYTHSYCPVYSRIEIQNKTELQKYKNKYGSWCTNIKIVTISNSIRIFVHINTISFVVSLSMRGKYWIWSRIVIALNWDALFRWVNNDDKGNQQSRIRIQNAIIVILNSLCVIPVKRMGYFCCLLSVLLNLQAIYDDNFIRIFGNTSINAMPAVI